MKPVMSSNFTRLTRFYVNAFPSQLWYMQVLVSVYGTMSTVCVSITFRGEGERVICTVSNILLRAKEMRNCGKTFNVRFKLSELEFILLWLIGNGWSKKGMTGKTCEKWNDYHYSLITTKWNNYYSPVTSRQNHKLNLTKKASCSNQTSPRFKLLFSYFI